MHARARLDGTDEWGGPAGGPVLPDDPVLVVLRWAWRYRHELGPFYVALGLATFAGIGYDYAPRLWPLALLLGAGVTAAAWHWRADRPAKRAYVLTVGAAATLWTAAAWWASPAHGWLTLTALAGAVAAGVPRFSNERCGWWIRTGGFLRWGGGCRGRRHFSEGSVFRPDGPCAASGSV